MGILFIYDESESENNGFFCAQCGSCENVKKRRDVTNSVCLMHYVHLSMNQKCSFGHFVFDVSGGQPYSHVLGVSFHIIRAK